MKRSDLHFPGIYKFTNKQNGKVYIGQAQNIFQRLASHKYKLNKTSISRALFKYGFDAFAFEVLERVDDLNKLNEREQYWMDFYCCTDKKKGYNVNPVAGSCRGVKRSPEQIEKLRERGRLLIGSANPNFGKTHSEETRKLIGDSHRGKPLSAEHRAKCATPQPIEKLLNMNKLSVSKSQKKIAQIDPETNETVRVWNAVSEIKGKLGFSASCIGDACRGYYWCAKRNGYFIISKYKGYIWKYVSEGIKPTPTAISKSAIESHPSKRVSQINLLSGEVLKIWGSANEIQNTMGIKIERIQDTCRGKYWCSKRKKYCPKTSHAGFKWQYVTE